MANLQRQRIQELVEYYRDRFAHNPEEMPTNMEQAFMDALNGYCGQCIFFTSPFCKEHNPSLQLAMVSGGCPDRKIED